LARQLYIMEHSAEYIQAPGIILPKFEEELDARTSMITVWGELKEKDKSLKHKYFDELEKVKDKGLMKEYIWTFLKRSSWKKPEGMKLKEFKKWLKQNMPDHKAGTALFAKESEFIHICFAI